MPLQAASDAGFTMDMVQEESGVITLSHAKLETRISLLFKETTQGPIIDINAAYHGKDRLLSNSFAAEAVIKYCGHLANNAPDAELFVNGKPYHQVIRERRSPAFRTN